ncbi:molybdate ABC transporter substrate-binding protein [Paenibacillus glycanilyticus]|uniref:Molybdate ABC transporter substrate-binding protein n=1 Tax=Paenibacillus glycanilyticus TaxID=126569 RepID=A0ABQ6NJH1_9BACL|nr:molybdate ABC transporter substrate-binding protein [Paenibacillus glycanilyticus]GMK44312.1 molybdate ABC transporter substrate-binding protein [Paenibacillus glycanilyticus]
MRRNFKSSLVLLGLIIIILVMAACAKEEPQRKVELTISAAASLTDALNDIQKMYEEKNPNVKLNFNFGASGALQQQIEQGAPADLFLSAAAKNLKALVDKQLIDTDKQTNLLSNELVVVVPADGGIALATENDLTKAEVKHVAVGIPESVPAGNYAKESLTNAKLWDSLQAKSVQGKDVRQVLQYVETGNADAGFVYKTDALTSDKVKIAFNVDPATYTAIQYPIGIVKATKHSKEAEDFYAYLQSQEALDVFVKYGFSVPAK